MGCLLELLFEVVFEILLEVIFAIYTKLMTLFVPEHQFSPRLKERIKKGITAFAALLLLCALVGFFMFLQPPSLVKTIGAYMLFIPLGIIAVQIVVGIICRIVEVFKKKL